MKIGIIGAGNIGQSVARLFAGAGHDIAISNSRGPETLHSLVQELGPRAQATSAEDAARFGEIVFLAIPWRNCEGLPRPADVRGKIVVDAMNPYTPNGTVYDLGDSTSSEETLKRLPGARLVKAFNTIWYKRLATEGRKDLPLEARMAVFVAGDDTEAKSVVSCLIEEIGFAPVDNGSLRDGGRRQQPGSPIYNQPLTAAEARKFLKTIAGQAA